MKLTKTQLLDQRVATLEHMTVKAAHDLEARLSGNHAKIKQEGIVRITDEHGNTRSMRACYTTEELLRLLDKGMDIRSALATLQGEIVLG